jgi:CheY-like chemotaxis protein
MPVELFSTRESNSRGMHGTTTRGPILLATNDSNDVYTFWGYHKQCGVHNRVEIVSDGEDALRYLASTTPNHPLPALVIISLTKPRVGGLKVLEQLAEKHPKLPKVPNRRKRSRRGPDCRRLQAWSGGVFDAAARQG